LRAVPTGRVILEGENVVESVVMVLQQARGVHSTGALALGDQANLPRPVTGRRLTDKGGALKEMLLFHPYNDISRLEGLYYSASRRAATDSNLSTCDRISSSCIARNASPTRSVRWSLRLPESAAPAGELRPWSGDAACCAA